jgi:sugar phosphate isomerase/epimerase
LAACLLGFSSRLPDGGTVDAAPAEHWADVMAQVSQAGFDHVEISDGWLSLAALSEARLAEFAAVVAAAGLQIPAVHLQRRSVVDPVDGPANLKYAHAMIDAVAALGAKIFSTGLHRPLTAAQQQALWFWTVDGPADRDDADTRALAVTRIRELGRHAAEVGLTMSLELYEDTYLGTAERAVRFVQDVDLDTVGLNPDVGNLIRLHRSVESWQELYEQTLPYANYWHAKNYARDEAADGSWFTATPATLRDGMINYRWAVRRALELGFRAPITCEHYGGDSLGVGAANRDYLRTLLPPTY